jgi:DNA repair protein RadA
MSHVSDLQLQDLPGVEPYMINKLKRAGIQSVTDLAVSTPVELIAGDYADNSPIEADIETVFQLITKAKRALMNFGVLDKEFCSAEQLLEKRSQLVRFTTGSKDLDTLLKGGIESQALTEFVGEFGSGKSQLCHTLCVTANTNAQTNGEAQKLVGKINPIIFVDTENTFRPERVHQIAEARGGGLDHEEIMKKIFVCRIHNSAQLEAVIKNLGKYIEQYEARLVIIDSIISLHRAEYSRRETLAERQQRLNIMLHKLVRLAEIYNVAVVYTNQVQSQPGVPFGTVDPTRAAGGNIIAHSSSYRIFLKKAGRNRIAIMLDSPHHAYSQVKFAIGEGGVQDVEVEKVSSSSSNESGR